MKLKYITLASLMSLSVANGAVVTLTNADFETFSGSGELNIQAGAITGWAELGSGTIGTYNPDNVPANGYYSNPNINDASLAGGVIGTMSGSTAAFLFGTNDGAITQTTSEAVVAGTVYTLTVAIGHRDLATQDYGGYNIQLLDGDSTLATMSSLDIVANGSFGDVTLMYTGQAADSGNLRIRIGIGNTSGSNYLDVDNVRLDATPVPEPSSTALLGLGGLALILRRRK